MLDWLKWIFALIGHIGLWCAVFNQIHATAFPRRHRKISELVIYNIILWPMLWVVWRWFWESPFPIERLSLAGRGYAYLAIVIGVWLTARWLPRWWWLRRPDRVRALPTRYCRIGQQCSHSLLAGPKARLFGRIPGNQTLDLAIESLEIQFDDLHPDLEGITICQLSDLHFTGMVLPEYFQMVVEKANALQPDMIVVTGDLIDERKCLDWLDSVLSQLQARLGKWYVLGNHDLRVGDEGLLRRRIHDAGLVGVADGEWHDVQIGQARLRMTGNELPWFPHAAELASDAALPPADFRLLLTHSPDQIDWASRWHFDLILAGHTHGGQIRFPLIGAIVAPSRYGVKYASGTFAVGDAIMHVSRGLSGDEPIRWLCPPELT